MNDFKNWLQGYLEDKLQPQQIDKILQRLNEAVDNSNETIPPYPHTPEWYAAPHPYQKPYFITKEDLEIKTKEKIDEDE